IAASSNVANLIGFVHGMLPPAIPTEFCYETLPKTLFGIESGDVEFRKHVTEPASGLGLGGLFGMQA
ncbi:MAG TPA: hypothetical protein VKA82_20610, partial [Rubrobacter sp.]|nr:hypothetical protein [Rubrobacter sp.]